MGVSILIRRDRILNILSHLSDQVNPVLVTLEELVVDVLICAFRRHFRILWRNSHLVHVQI